MVEGLGFEELADSLRQQGNNDGNLVLIRWHRAAGAQRRVFLELARVQTIYKDLLLSGEFEVQSQYCVLQTCVSVDGLCIW